jgi:peptidoglycan/LPS O-acetylase OafA/YrhL
VKGRSELNGTTYLPTLDGWRAIAILAVMVCHAGDELFGPGGGAESARWHHLTRFGAHGVDVFFGLSGFLITRRLLEEKAARGDIHLGGFYVRRAFRILPPYLLYLVAVGLLGAAGVLGVGRLEWWSSALFFRNYLPELSSSSTGGGWYTAHFWSLAVEEHFYLLWPALLILTGASRRSFWVAGALVFAIALWRVIDFRTGVSQGLLPGVGGFMRSDWRMDGLFAGCAAAVAFPALRGRLSRNPARSSALTLAALAALIACIVLAPPLAMLWQSLLIALLVSLTAGASTTSLLSRALELAPVRWVGRISYSLYLWQQLFLLERSVGAPPLGVLQRLPLNVLAVFTAAVLSHYLLERPLLRLGHALSSRLRVAASPHPAVVSTPS